MKSVKRRVAVCSFVAVAAAALLASRGLCRCCRGVDARGWQLPQLVEHLNGRGLRLRAVPSRQDGQWDDTIYLTQDQSATWETFQRKNLNVERIADWQGSVYLHRIGPWTDLESHLIGWKEHGARIGDFLLFGDLALLDRIRDSLGQPRPR